jgi:P63C domain
MGEDKPIYRVGKAGGDARAEKLTKERMRQIAAKGAMARWGAQATHKGNFQGEFGIDVDCYVLNDEQKTAVISQRGMGAALGMGQIGSRLPRFVSGQAISKYIGPELRQKLEKPTIFQLRMGGPEASQTQIFGYDVTILIDLCKAISAAEADGARINPAVAKQAHVILSASAKAGIKGLVYALAGYSPAIEEVIAAFKEFVREEAREYEKEFPPLLYKEWQRLYEIKGPISRNWKGMHLTIDHVYHPLAKSQGRILKLARGARDASDSRHNKLHQFLSEIGVKALRTHLGQVLGVARISRTREEYEHNIDVLFPDGDKKSQLDLPYEAQDVPSTP